MFKKNGQISSIEYSKAIVKAELLTEEVERLRAQVDRLQEALVAAAAPKAYEALQQDKYRTPDLTLTPEQLKIQQDNIKEQNFTKNYIENLEKSLFNDADDLISNLGAVIGINVGAEPIHSNDEG